MSKGYNPTETQAYLEGPRGVGNDLGGLRGAPGVVLLLMEEGKAGRDVAGHQVRVLDGEPLQLTTRPAATATSPREPSLRSSRAHTHTVTSEQVFLKLRPF